MAGVFNKSALERLSSPEQLDKAITVTHPASWLALIGVTVMILATLAWAVFGTLPVTLQAQGIVPSGNLLDEQVATCFVPYSESAQIKAGMKAIIYNTSNDSRYEAEVMDVSFDSAAYSDMELVFGGDGIAATVLLRIKGARLPEKTIITAKVILEESAPIHMLFKGF